MQPTGIVSGQVIRTSGEPLGRAGINLVRAGTKPPLTFAAISDAGYILNDPPSFDRPGFARTDQEGRFWFRQIRPGSHWLFAIASMRPGVSLADLWEKHQGTAQKVAVDANGYQDVVMRLDMHDGR